MPRLTIDLHEHPWKTRLALDGRLLPGLLRVVVEVEPMALSTLRLEYERGADGERRMIEFRQPRVVSLDLTEEEAAALGLLLGVGKTVA